MECPEEPEFGERVNAAVKAHDARLLEAAVDEVAGYYFQNPSDDGVTFPDDKLAVILEQMTQPGFQQMPGAFHLLMLLQFDWSTLKPSQKAKLLPAIEDAYPKFADWMSCFVLSELLGKFYCDREGLDCLARLRKSTSEIARSLLPLGFEHIVRYSEDANLGRLALEQLRALDRDPSGKVRHEASESMTRLSRKEGPDLPPGVRIKR